MIINGKDEELKLDYPCNWSYRIICEDADKINEIIVDVISERDFSVKVSNTSKTGKYHSFNVELLVHHDDDRLGLFELFKKHPEIKMVL